MPKIHQLTDFDRTDSQSYSADASVLTHGHCVFAEDEGTPGCYIFDSTTGKTEFCALTDTRMTESGEVAFWVFTPSGTSERKYVIFNT